MLAEISIWCYIALIELIIIIIAIMIGNHRQNKLTTYKIYHEEIGQHIETIMLNEVSQSMKHQHQMLQI